TEKAANISVWPTAADQSGEELFVPLGDPHMVNSEEIALFSAALSEVLTNGHPTRDHLQPSEVAEVMERLNYETVGFFRRRTGGGRAGGVPGPPPRRDDPLRLYHREEMGAVADGAASAGGRRPDAGHREIRPPRGNRFHDGGLPPAVAGGALVHLAGGGPGV